MDHRLTIQEKSKTPIPFHVHQYYERFVKIDR